MMNRLILRIRKGYDEPVDTALARASFARSATVFVAVQNTGGEFFHSIESTRGHGTSCLLRSSDGHTTPSFGMFEMFRFKR